MFTAIFMTAAREANIPFDIDLFGLIRGEEQPEDSFKKLKCNYALLNLLETSIYILPV